MLEVLEAAQAGRPEGPAGRRDRPGLDLRPRRLRRRRRRHASAFAAPSHPPIPTHEFERPELLAMEKESVGVFITEHPLKRLREALQIKADCAIAEIPERKDGEWVKVGGMITEAKKIRTRSGSAMMFATVDDLEGTVEVRRLREGARGRRGRAGPGRDRARARPRGPQGRQQGLHRRLRRRSLRPLRGRDREGQGQAGRAARRRGAQAPAAAGGRGAPGGHGRRGAARAVRALPGQRRLRAGDADAHRPALPALRGRVPDRGPQRGAEVRAAHPARRRDRRPAPAAVPEPAPEPAVA